MAMKEQDSRKTRHKRRKVLQEMDSAGDITQDPSIYLEEKITLESPAAAAANGH